MKTFFDKLKVGDTFFHENTKEYWQKVSESEAVMLIDDIPAFKDEFHPDDEVLII